MEATPTTVTSLTLNDATQNYVQELPSESRTPLVHGGEVGVVVELKESDTDVHAIMAETLPKQVIIQSNLNHLYLHLYAENPDVPSALRYAGDYSFDLDTRFELEKSATRTGLVHIRCMRNNKYWEKFGTSSSWITATAVKPEENESDAHCTLFLPVFLLSNNNRLLMLRHVNTGHYASLFDGDGPYDGALYLSSSISNQASNCIFIDWESVVVLPDLIRIKGNNGNHLKPASNYGPMQFLDKADNSWDYEYEVSPSRNGGIRLKSSRYGTYWAGVDNDFVKLATPHSAVHETRMVFLPTVLDAAAKRIIMKCLKNDKFCKRHTDVGIENGLATLAYYPDKYSSMEYERAEGPLTGDDDE